MSREIICPLPNHHRDINSGLVTNVRRLTLLARKGKDKVFKSVFFIKEKKFFVKRQIINKYLIIMRMLTQTHIARDKERGTPRI